jgi:hypothetical protein
MADAVPVNEKTLNYSPLQSSVYTAVEYTIPLQLAAPDLSVLHLGTQFLPEATNVVIRGGRVKSREGTAWMTTGISGSVIVGGFEHTLHNASAMYLLATTTNVYLYDKGASSLTAMLASSWVAPNNDSHVDWVPMRTASSGLRLLVVTVSPPSAVQEPVRWWDGNTASTFTVMSTAVQGNCGIMWKSHFLLGDTNDIDGLLPYRVHWSALGDPTVWDGTASAGSIDLLDKNTSRIWRFMPLRRNLLAYKEQGVHSLTYKDPPFYFTQQLESEQLSLIGRSAVVSVNDGDSHFLVTRDGIMLWDGQTVTPIGRNRVDRTILRDLDYLHVGQVTTSYYPLTQEVMLTYSTRTSVMCWVYNLEFNSWSTIDKCPHNGTTLYKVFASGSPRFVANDRRSQPSQILVYFVGVGDQVGSSSSAVVTSSVVTPPLDFGSFAGKRVLKIHPLLRLTNALNENVFGQSTVDVSVQGSEVPWDGVVGGNVKTVTMPFGGVPPQPMPTVSEHIDGRYITVKMEYVGINTQVEFGSVVLLPTLRTDARLNKTV